MADMLLDFVQFVRIFYKFGYKLQRELKNKFLFCLIKKNVEKIMKNDFLNLKNEYQKINKNKQLNHIVLQNNYNDLCMKFFADKYNTICSQQLAEDGCMVAIESEDVFVNWLNKE